MSRRVLTLGTLGGVEVRLVQDLARSVSAQVLWVRRPEAELLAALRAREDLPARLREAAEREPWVARAMVRLREHGRVLTGEVFVVPRDEADLLARFERTCERLVALDWRLHELTVVPVRQLEAHPPPKT